MLISERNSGNHARIATTVHRKKVPCVCVHARFVLTCLPKVETLEEVEELVILGGRNRTVGNNNVNEHSSRSHLVLQVQIVSTDLTTGYVQHGRLNLIDLAGSERIKVKNAWKTHFHVFLVRQCHGPHTLASLGGSLSHGVCIFCSVRSLL